ncbi:hypothetical protein NGK36_17255 [Hafnia alvei]|uniref:hypothetical protein n=1 Tax=Hafnia alvei TaxID=569 RepID=UPI002DBCB5D9|nr:hypothetical protein [Hafnia alvei]MEB7891020.1 hypothetical protein [Hafnia alvei]
MQYGPHLFIWPKRKLKPMNNLSSELLASLRATALEMKDLSGNPKNYSNQEAINIYDSSDSVFTGENVLALIKELEHWQSNHTHMVNRAALLRQRPDLPVDRIPAFDNYAALQRRAEEAEARAEAFRTNYESESDQLKQIKANWRQLAAASGWFDEIHQNAVNNGLPYEHETAIDMAASWKARAEEAESKLETIKRWSDE